MTIVLHGVSPFARILELINKTNQFNTTCRRWTSSGLERFIASDGKVYAFTVSDSFTTYGLVGVVLIDGCPITQRVMSCRVIGYQVENAVVETLIARISGGSGSKVSATLIEKDANFPCRTLLADTGFAWDGENWVRDAKPARAIPAHITIDIARV